MYLGQLSTCESCVFEIAECMRTALDLKWLCIFETAGYTWDSWVYRYSWVYLGHLVVLGVLGTAVYYAQ